MSLLDNIKAKLEALNQQANRQPSGESKEFKSITWKPNPGKQIIRVLPNLPLNLDHDNPFLPLNIYFNLTKRWLISPENFDRPDPVIEYCNALIPEGTRLPKDEWNVVNDLKKSLLPQLRIYVPVLVRGEEHLGVRYWGFSPKIYMQFKEFFQGDYSDAASLTNGIDFTVDFTPSPDKNDPRHANTVIAPRRNSSPASEDPTVIKLINEMPNILDSFHEPTYEELKTALKTFLQIPKKEKDPVVEEKPKSNNLNVTIDHDATNEGFEIEKKDRVKEPVNIDDIEAIFAGLGKK